jgi:lysylphosphatidylglycerol synthetase-like protein (DUF2156 family)
MNATEIENQRTVLGQKYAYATASLVLGIVCFVNLAGMEKAVLAVIFAWLALKSNPAPVLKDRRVWAKTGLVLGTLVLILVPTVLLIFFNRLTEVIELFSKLSNGR